MIRGIDNQIAVQRLNDLTKDATAQLRRPELTHDFQARINRELEARQQQQVLELEQKDEVLITRERDASQDPTGEEQRKRRKKKPGITYEDLLSGAIAPDPERHQLDIEV